MIITSSHMLLLILITQAIYFSEQIKWITESRTIYVCKGNDVDLLWEFDEEGDIISKLEWYFNNNIICTSSYAKNFTVNIPYQGRIERLGKTAIQLKNISQDDEGIFSLLPLLTWSTNQNMQNILLRVLESPTNKCTCKISYMGHLSKLACELTTSYCGRPQMSVIWKRKETFEVLGEQNYILINSSFQDNEILACLEGTAMKCVDDPRQFCTSVNITDRDDEKSSKGRNNVPQIDSVTMQVLHQHDTESTNMHNLQPYFFVVGLIVSSLLAIVTLVVIIILLIKRKNSMDKAYQREKRVKNLKTKEVSTNTEKQMVLPLLETNSGQHSAFIHAKIHDVEHERMEETIKHESSTNSENIQNLHHNNLHKICSDNSLSVVYRPSS